MMVSLPPDNPSPKTHKIDSYGAAIEGCVNTNLF